MNVPHDSQPNAPDADILAGGGLREVNLGVTCVCNLACRFCGKRLEHLILDLKDRHILREVMAAAFSVPLEDADVALSLLPEIKSTRGIEGLVAGFKADSIGSVSMDPDSGVSVITAALDRLRGVDRPLYRRMCAEALLLLRNGMQTHLRTRLPVEAQVVAIRDAARLGARTVGIAGPGEPTVAGVDLLRIMREIKTLGVSGDLISNGTLIDEHAAREIATMGWDHFVWSVHSADPAVHDALTGVPGSFEDGRRGVERLILARKQAGGERPELWFNTALTTRNLPDLFSVLELAVKMGARQLNFLPLAEIPFVSEWDKLAVQGSHAAEARRILAAVAEQARSAAIATNAPGLLAAGEFFCRLAAPAVFSGDCFKPLEDEAGECADAETRPPHAAFCLNPWRSVTIDFNGDVRPCCLPLRTLTMGNIGRESLKAIWTGERYRTLRRRMLSNRPPDECAKVCTPACRMPSETWRREAAQTLGANFATP